MIEDNLTLLVFHVTSRRPRQDLLPHAHPITITKHMITTASPFVRLNQSDHIHTYIQSTGPRDIGVSLNNVDKTPSSCSLTAKNR